MAHLAAAFAEAGVTDLARWQKALNELEQVFRKETA